MKKGDKVHLINREEVTGEIIDIKITDIWGTDFYEYLVKYDKDDLIPPQDWHEEAHLIILPTLPKNNGFSLKCECGVSKVMSNGKHSKYCPLYRSY